MQNDAFLRNKNEKKNDYFEYMFVFVFFKGLKELEMDCLM